MLGLAAWWRARAAQSTKRKDVSPQLPEGAAWNSPTERNGRSEYVTTGVVAFANLGLTSDVFHGMLWDMNRADLVQEAKEILSNERTLGVCFSEVGPLGPTEREKFEDAMREATNAIGNTSWLYPEFAGPKADGNTFAMWRAKAEVEHLPPLTNCGEGKEAFRSVEVFRLWLTENASLVICNQHQTRTEEAPYRLNAKVRVCQAIIEAALREQQEQPTNVGLICRGPAMCDWHTWTHALLMHNNRAEVQRRFGPMQYIYARQAIADEVEIKKHGDCYVALTNKDLVLRQRDCNIRNRDEEHDVVLMDWSFTYYDWPRGATEHTQDRRVRPRNDKARDLVDPSSSSEWSSSGDWSDDCDEGNREADEEGKNAEESCDWSPDSAEADEEGKDAAESGHWSPDSAEDDEDGEELQEERDPEELQRQQERIWSCAIILGVACKVLPGAQGKNRMLMQPPPDLDVPQIAWRDLAKAVDTLLLVPETASAAEHGNDKARRMRPMHEITVAWEEVFLWRRTQEPDDTKQLSPEQISRAWTMWMHDWMKHNLTKVQRRKPHSRKTSIFGSFVHRSYGSKHLVLALLETGVTWAPPKSARREEAYAHVAKQFVHWLRHLTRAIRIHKAHPMTQEAQQRSGFVKGASGLTPEQRHIRDMRDELREEWLQAVRLEARVKAAKRKGETTVKMTAAEKQILADKRSGRTWKLLQRANTLHGGTVGAKQFTTMVDDR